MKRALLTIVLVGALGACQADSPAEPFANGPSLATVPSGLSPLEQSLTDALLAGQSLGSLVDRDVGCGTLVGFSDASGLVAFGGLFPLEGPQGICPLSNFARTNRDGTVDQHLQGSGGFFLLVFDPFASFPSEGSSVRWRAVSHQGGTSMFTITGTLSDGRRVRAHFVTDPRGDNKAANTLWVEGIGYVVGGPPGQAE